MTAIELYRFIVEKDIEWHEHADRDDIIVFINTYHIDEWIELLGDSILDESGIECNMKSGYFCFWAKDICEYFGINKEDVFKPLPSPPSSNKIN